MIGQASQGKKLEWFEKKTRLINKMEKFVRKQINKKKLLYVVQ